MARLVDTNPEKMLGHIEIDSDIKLAFVDRIRVLFGCRLAVRTHVHTRWRVSEFNAQNIMLVEEFFSGWKHRTREFFRRLKERLV